MSVGIPRRFELQIFANEPQLPKAMIGGIKLSMSANDLITVDPEILGGTPVFKGTRVPIKSLFEYLEDDYSLDEFLNCFPSVTRVMACQVLERSESALLEPAA